MRRPEHRWTFPMRAISDEGTSPCWSVSVCGQLERGHLFAVAHEQRVADEHRMVPGLAFNCRQLRDLGELIRRRRHERELTFFRKHQQQILIRQEHELTITVAAAFPLALPVL